MNEAVKQFTTVPTTQVAPEPAPAPVEDPLVNNMSEEDAGIEFGNDVQLADFDWSEIPEHPETDNAGNFRQPQPAQEEGQQSPDQAAADPTQAEEENLTESMRERITKLKQAEAEKLQGRDATIESQAEDLNALGSELGKYKELVQSYHKIQGELKQPEGSAEQIKADLDAIDARVDEATESGEDLTPAEVFKLSTERNKLERQLDEVNAYSQKVQQLANHAQALRAESDKRTEAAYPFATQPDSAKYKVMKTQAYPMLEAIIPGFSQSPYDVALAAELSDMMVDAHEYRKIMGKVSPSNRQVPPNLASATPATNVAPPTRHSNAAMMAKMRSGEMDPVDVLNNMGMGWNPGNQ